MLDRLQDIKLTIDLNEDILIDSVDDTNDLVVSDLLKDLGYDRKRSNRIQRLRKKAIKIKQKIEEGEKEKWKKNF